MNCVQHVLDKDVGLEVPEAHVHEALRCLLHTIIFVRWPSQRGVLRPHEVTPPTVHEGENARSRTRSNSRNRASCQVQCEHFPLAYVSCGIDQVNERVEEAIRRFMDHLVPAGPELNRGCITLTFFEQRKNKNLFGWTFEEKIVWEEWVIPVLVNSAPQSATNVRISGLAPLRPRCLSSPLTVPRLFPKTQRPRGIVFRMKQMPCTRRS